jgi:sec-independent protein translocase protein TatB
MPAGLSPMHLLVIAVVALVVLGPDKLPDAARQAGRFVAQAREFSAGLTAQIERSMAVDDQSSASATTGAPPEADPEDADRARARPAPAAAPEGPSEQEEQP